MRKADYSALAAIIKNHRDSTHHASHYSNETRDIVKAKLVSLAEGFARVASVDKAEFLKACGIE